MLGTNINTSVFSSGASRTARSASLDKSGAVAFHSGLWRRARRTAARATAHSSSSSSATTKEMKDALLIIVEIACLGRNHEERTKERDDELHFVWLYKKQTKQVMS